MIEEKIYKHPALTMAIIGWLLISLAVAIEGGFVRFLVFIGFGLLFAGVGKFFVDKIENDQ